MGSTINIKFKVGDTAFIVEPCRNARLVPCPDCQGNRFLTIIMGDDTQHTIPCAGCASGFDPPKGYVETYDSEPKVRRVRVDGVDVETDGDKLKVSYRTEATNCSWRPVDEEDLFDNEESAKARTEALKIERQREYDEQLRRKTKTDRSWAWHVHYHRKRVKDAEKDLAYHTAQLDYAKTVAKGTPTPEAKDGETDNA